MYAPEDLEIFLEMAGRGNVSGNVSEWPQLKPACRYATLKILEFRNHIDILETVTRDLLAEIKQFREEVKNAKNS